MSFTLTPRAEKESLRPKIEPQLVLEIEGVGTLFGAVQILRLIRVGDPGLLIGEDWRIGGLVAIGDQKENISFDGGSTTRIEQQLYPDKGSVSSVSSALVALNDEDLFMSQLITPGLIVEDLLGRKAVLWIGFKNTAFKEDYIRIFSGIIDDIESGSGQVKINIAHAEQKKRQQLFDPISVVVSDTISDTDDVVPLVSSFGLAAPVVGPDGSTIDTAISFYIKVEDEIIKYTSIVGNDLHGCVRGQLGTLPKRHQINMVWTCLCQFTIANYLINLTPSGHFTFIPPGSSQKYYVWYKTVIFATPVGIDPAIPDAIGIPVDFSVGSFGGTAESVAAYTKAAIDAAIPGIFTITQSGPSLRFLATDAGEGAKPDPATSGFIIDVIDEGKDEIEGKSLVQISDSAINCALKLMLSGLNDFYTEDLPATQYLHPDPFTTIANSIFFRGVDLNRDYGVVAGDFVTITDALNGANNCTAKVIQEIVTTDEGSYIIVEDVSFVAESSSTALVSFRSQYDTLGVGLGMTPDQVDVLEHTYWHNFILAPYSYRFVIQDQINGKDFLDKEIYLPIGAFSLPRQGRCSMGYTVGPIVRDAIKTLDRTNIKSPDKIKLKRALSRNFYNTVVYQMDEKLDGKFATGFVAQDADSQARIPVGNKAFTVTSKGLRRSNSGTLVATSVSTRFLNRYKFAAEYFENIPVLFRDGFTIEPGDVVLFDPTLLQVTNTLDGTRNKEPKLFFVANKKMDIKTGDASVSLVDANFDSSERYGTVSPSSLIVSGTTTRLKIKDSFGILYPGNESKKWVSYFGLPIIVHSPDWSFAEEVTLLGIDPTDSYTLLIDPTTPLSLAPSLDYIVDIGSYPATANPSDNSKYKALHAFLSASIAIVSGTSATEFEVDSGDISKFAVGSKMRVHDADFGTDSGEVEVVSATGTTVTCTALGFTPDNTMVVEGLDFADDGSTYKFF